MYYPRCRGSRFGKRQVVLRRCQRIKRGGDSAPERWRASSYGAAKHGGCPRRRKAVLRVEDAARPVGRHGEVWQSLRVFKVDVLVSPKGTQVGQLLIFTGLTGVHLVQDREGGRSPGARGGFLLVFCWRASDSECRWSKDVSDGAPVGGTRGPDRGAMQSLVEGKVTESVTLSVTLSYDTLDKENSYREPRILAISSADGAKALRKPKLFQAMIRMQKEQRMREKQ